MFDQLQHSTRRDKFYKEVKDFWHDLDGDEYALFDCYSMSEEEIHEIRVATEIVGQVYIKTASILRELSDEILLQLDIPQAVLPYIRTKSLAAEMLISRVDLVKTPEGLKVLEVNADTPTFEKEVFHVNGQVANHFNYDDPNEGFENKLAETIHTTVQKSLQSLQKPMNANIIFTSHGDHEEDRLTTRYLMEISGLNARYVPLDQLQLCKEDGRSILLDDLGEPVDVLYRQTYPLEHLVNDKDPDTEEYVGVELMKLIHEKSIICFNPLSAFLLQSKAVQAVIWGLHEEGSTFYTKEEHQWIDTYFLPTYLDAEPFLEQSVPFVKKPSFGREGDTVEVYDADGKMVNADQNKTYKESIPVYQKYVSLPTTTINTCKGQVDAHLLIGSFLIKGEASAIGLRAGNQITDNQAYFLPVGMYNVK
ncbi:glutathionylspermidine synthase family protein [Pseudalkalibacillus berkeleyi]|uniref:Glutathionylspermidine synthase family protein n=1 Tax=Pseudalkalibacillus berkeleyi TaxID=1069813 RepID=A0ABS9H0L3_9BACL|nr:glutathionylspermidine synthase family protein [Pseudalkalibacillus berkeleyi]MCF6137332.1 glutathionylspermidine synthase family protein [Pseudalkalibacillus berkeleyi]